MKQPKTPSSIMGDMKTTALKMGRAISKFFEYNQIPPNVAASPSYRAIVDTIAAEVGPGVRPPPAYKINRKYLDMEYSDYTLYLENHFTTWKEYGCMLMCDWWTSNSRQHIINFNGLLCNKHNFY